MQREVESPEKSELQRPFPKNTPLHSFLIFSYVALAIFAGGNSNINQQNFTCLVENCEKYDGIATSSGNFTAREISAHGGQEYISR